MIKIDAPEENQQDVLRTPEKKKLDIEEYSEDSFGQVASACKEEIEQTNIMFSNDLTLRNKELEQKTNQLQDEFNRLYEELQSKR